MDEPILMKIYTNCSGRQEGCFCLHLLLHIYVYELTGQEWSPPCVQFLLEEIHPNLVHLPDLGRLYTQHTKRSGAVILSNDKSWHSKRTESSPEAWESGYWRRVFRAVTLPFLTNEFVKPQPEKRRRKEVPEGLSNTDSRRCHWGLWLGWSSCGFWLQRKSRLCYQYWNCSARKANRHLCPVIPQ